MRSFLCPIYMLFGVMSEMTAIPLEEINIYHALRSHDNETPILGNCGFSEEQYSDKRQEAFNKLRTNYGFPCIPTDEDFQLDTWYKNMTKECQYVEMNVSKGVLGFKSKQYHNVSPERAELILSSLTINNEPTMLFSPIKTMKNVEGQEFTYIRHDLYHQYYAKQQQKECPKQQQKECQHKRKIKVSEKTIQDSTILKACGFTAQQSREERIKAMSKLLFYGNIYPIPTNPKFLFNHLYTHIVDNRQISPNALYVKMQVTDNILTMEERAYTKISCDHCADTVNLLFNRDTSWPAVVTQDTADDKRTLFVRSDLYQEIKNNMHNTNDHEAKNQ